MKQNGYQKAIEKIVIEDDQFYMRRGKIVTIYFKLKGLNRPFRYVPRYSEIFEVMKLLYKLHPSDTTKLIRMLVDEFSKEEE